MKAQAFIVRLKGKKIDKVYYDSTMTKEEVKKSLVEHDNYDPEIVVKKEHKKWE